ncbi:MAG: hypothetical protein U0414_31430 [Polyangiaceae bacterium]
MLGPSFFGGGAGGGSRSGSALLRVASSRFGAVSCIVSASANPRVLSGGPALSRIARNSLVPCSAPPVEGGRTGPVACGALFVAGSSIPSTAVARDSPSSRAVLKRFAGSTASARLNHWSTEGGSEVSTLDGGSASARVIAMMVAASVSPRNGSRPAIIS